MRKAHDYCPNCGSYDTNIEALCLVEPMKCNHCGHSFQPEVVSDSLLCYGLPEYNGWKAYYEFPGFISYRRPEQDVGLIVCSDWDGDKSTLLIDVVDEFGERIPSGLGVLTNLWEHWPSEGRTSRAMFELIKPTLDEITGLRRRHPCTKCGAILCDEIEDECSNPGEGCCPPEVTDEQIRMLLSESVANGNFQAAREALGEACIPFDCGGYSGYRFPTEVEKQWARARCAQIIRGGK